MRMSEKFRNNNNYDNPLTSRRTDGGKNPEKSHDFVVGSKFRNWCTLLIKKLY